MRHYAINHSLERQIHLLIILQSDRAQYTYTRYGKHMRNKKISSLHPVKIVYNLYKRFTNFQIDKFIKLKSFLVHFPLSTFVHYTIRPSFEPPYVCACICVHIAYTREQIPEQREIERWCRMEKLSIPITNPSDASSDPETIGTFLVRFRIDQPSLSDDASTSVGVAVVVVGHGRRASGSPRMRPPLPCTEHHQPRNHGSLRPPSGPPRPSVRCSPVPESLRPLPDPVSWCRLAGYPPLRRHPRLSCVQGVARQASPLPLSPRRP